MMGLTTVLDVTGTIQKLLDEEGGGETQIYLALFVLNGIDLDGDTTKSSTEKNKNINSCKTSGDNKIDDGSVHRFSPEKKYAFHS